MGMGASHELGIAIAFFAACAVSSDGVLVKLASRDGANIAAVLVFKSASACITTIVLQLLLGPVASLCRGQPVKRPSVSRLGALHILVGGTFSALVFAGFTLSFYLTASANVLAFTALAPIWTSLFSKLALGDVIRRRTVLANMGALAGTIIVVIGVAVTSSSGSVTVANDVVGIICAILTGLASALFYTTLRSAFKRAPGTPMLWGSTYGMALSTLIGFACIPLAPPGDPLLPNKAAITWLVLNGACCVALALLAITFASSMTPAAEVSLIMQLEGLLGPISTYAVLGEVPTPYTLGGGALVLLSVAGHEALSIRDQRRKPDDGPQDGPAADEPVAAKAATDE